MYGLTLQQLAAQVSASVQGLSRDKDPSETIPVGHAKSPVPSVFGSGSLHFPPAAGALKIFSAGLTHMLE
jgi:hypothetical protein